MFRITPNAIAVNSSLSFATGISMQAGDTIYSTATGIGRAAVAIVRVSGPSCQLILKTMCPGACFLDRRATVARIVDLSGELIDVGMVIIFFAPRSFTGEDVVEFQVTGSRAVVNILLKTLSRFPATRPADAGEFARRSFANGKRDLSEIEGLASLVEAETIVQLRHAQRSASGQLSRECEEIRERLVRCMAFLEGFLDFSDIEDSETTASMHNVVAVVKDMRERTKTLLLDSDHPERLRDGLVVVIAGPPNAGKSSLINYLTKREVSIVSVVPGTTRDLIEVFVDIAGFPIVLIDTAGIRESDDPIEAEGIARARKKRESADLTLWLTSCLDDDDLDVAERCEVLRIKTKCDLAPHTPCSDEYITVSTVTGVGINILITRIEEFAHSQLGGLANSLVTTQRQRAAILEADSALERFLGGRGAPVELLAEELRFAARCMSRVVGRIDVEEVLENVFSRLCVGK
jgi:tRNA modification GTPase